MGRERSRKMARSGIIMMWPFFWGSKDIKDLFVRVLENRTWKGQKVLDFPAGSGFTSEYLKNKGANVEAYDLFPEYFKVPGLDCKKADLAKDYPIQDGRYDSAICQEGVEHLPNILAALKEFHRVLKNDGHLFVTTPNYSNLRSRFAYLLFESETPAMMPPNEIESIWRGEDERIYFGHIFSIGIMRLRCLARLAGFELVEVHRSRINNSSLYLFIIFLPFILLNSLKVYLRAKHKNKHLSKDEKRRVFNELLMLNLNPNILLGGHLIAEFKKVDHGNLYVARPETTAVT